MRFLLFATLKLKSCFIALGVLLTGLLIASCNSEAPASYQPLDRVLVPAAKVAATDTFACQWQPCYLLAIDFLSANTEDEKKKQLSRYILSGCGFRWHEETIIEPVIVCDWPEATQDTSSQEEPEPEVSEESLAELLKELELSPTPAMPPPPDSSMQAPEAPSPTTPSSALVPVASDSLYCRDAAFWRGYCRHWGELENGGCERIATCQDGEPTSVAVIVSDTAWVAADPAAHGWLRLPQKDPASFRQRWIHPHYVPWDTSQAYEEPLSPEQLGLVKYPFRGRRFLRILYGFPSLWGSFSVTVTEASSHSEPEPAPDPPTPESPTSEPALDPPAPESPTPEPAPDPPAPEPALDPPTPEPALDPPAPESPTSEPALDPPAPESPAPEPALDPPAPESPTPEPAPEPPPERAGLHGHVHVYEKGCRVHWHEWDQMNKDHGCPDYSDDPCGSAQDSNGKHTGDISPDGRCR